MRGQRVAALVAGASLGLLLGLLLGLAAAPVVGVVVGALTALIGGVLGLSNVGAKPDTPAVAMDRRLAMIGFGLACVGGILWGLNLRVRDVFAKSPQERVAEWQQAGYDSATSREMVALQVVGLVPSGRSVQAPLTAGQNTALRNARSDYCEAVSPARFGDVQSYQTALRTQNGPLQSLEATAASIADTSLRRRILRAGYDAVCPTHD